MSWASIAKAQPKPPTDSSSVGLTAKEGLRLLVVDANALIDGVKLEGIADRAVTIQEVLDEIRDKQSRQYLANLPFELEVSEPSEESIQAVTQFARATGDVAALSSVDIKLMALAHTLETAAHGSDHLLKHPNQPRMHTNKPTIGSEELPGWGSVANPEDWRAVDEANEADEAALMAAATSRIAQHVQQLSLDPSADNSFMQEPAAAAAAAAPPSAPLTPDAALTGSRPPGGLRPAASPSAGASASPAASNQEHSSTSLQQQPAVGSGAGSSGAAAGVDEAAGDADEWEVAASSKGAARHRKRKAAKRQQQQAAFEQEWAEHSQLVQTQQQQQQQQPVQQLDLGQQQVQQQQASQGSGGQPTVPTGDESSRHAADVSNDELLAQGHAVYTADDLDASSQEQEQQELTGAAQPLQQQQQQGCKPGSPGWQSSVAIITGDFAMQNVLLQMGLRLLTKDGRRIARLSRYALRCSACFTVTRDPGRLFCPKCGNLSLDRVEVVVGLDGAEYFGVTKRHILRGTRFSLPKPKGGRAADDFVLREDVFLQKVKALGRQAVKKKAADADGDDVAAAGSVDPFAPEYNQDTWHVPSQRELAQHRGLAAVLQPSWKHNPNERKLTRSNRRG